MQTPAMTADTITYMNAIPVMLRVGFSLLGIAAFAIGAMILFLGASATAGIFARVLSAMGATSADVDGLADPNTDNEMRFYSVLWIAYGALALWASRSVIQRMVWLRWMLVVFFVGGVGRAISYVSVGAPHVLFVVLMWIELLVPTILIPLSYSIARNDARRTGN